MMGRGAALGGVAGRAGRHGARQSALVLLVVLAANCMALTFAEVCQRPLIVEPAKLAGAQYPDWAHAHWVWPGGSLKNQADVLQYAHDYVAYDIPLGNVNVDSGWETAYNSFEFDTIKYPNASEMIREIHSLGSRVTFWITGHINVESPNWQYCKDRGYFLNDGKTVEWWHGTGSLFDFTHPEGLAWYHKQMQVVLSIGADGWKCDATSPYVLMLLEPGQSHKGPINRTEYADLYKRTFLEYSRTWNEEALIMSRPVDSLPPGYKHVPRLRFTPRDITFAGWVGDQDPGYYGLQGALLNMFASAHVNYVNIGSDIGGYRTDGSQVGRTKDAFLRWAAVGALSPLMENGGSGEHRPWMFGDDALQIYRSFAYLHEELRPFFHTEGADAFDAEPERPVMFYQGKCFYDGETKPWPDVCPYAWKLASDIFVAPIVTNSTTRSVTFPDAGETWVNWFDGGEYDGGSTHQITAGLDTIPLYLRAGSTIPLRVRNDLHGHYYGQAPRALTFLMTRPFGATTAHDAIVTRTVRGWKTSGTVLRHRATPRSMTISLTAGYVPVALLLWGLPSNAEAVSVDLIGSACHCDAADDCARTIDIADDIANYEREPLPFVGSRTAGDGEASWAFVDEERDMLVVHLSDRDTRRGAVVHIRIA